MDYHMTKYGTLYDSTAEVECEELEKLAKDTTFVQMLLTKLNLVELPSCMFEDNTGATILSSNLQMNKRTKDTDLKHHFVREFTNDKNVCNQGETFIV